MTSKVVIRTETQESQTPERRASFDKKEETQSVADILLSLREAEEPEKQEINTQNSVESGAHLKDAGRMPSLFLSPLPSSHLRSAPAPVFTTVSPIAPEFSELAEEEFEDDEGEEEEYFEEENALEDGDDDDWMENPKIPSQITRKVHTGLKRKKAPSGSACEKHKRWKKRCPEDCPLRKPKWRFFLPSHSHHSHSDDSSRWKREEVDRIVELLTSSRFDDWATSSRKLNSVLSCCRRKMSNSSFSAPKPQNRAEYISLIRSIILQLRKEGNSHTLNLLDEIEQRALCNEVTDGDTTELFEEPDTREDGEQQNDNNFKRKRESKQEEIPEKKVKIEHRSKSSDYVPTIACERHTVLHARCPPTCSDRRLARGRPPRGRKPKVKRDTDSPSPSPSGSSAVASPSLSVASTPAPSSPVAPAKNYNNNNTEEEIDHALKMVALADEELALFLHQSTSPAFQKLRDNTDRGRKYLATSCEKHKQSHSRFPFSLSCNRLTKLYRCPPNCPERSPASPDSFLQV